MIMRDIFDTDKNLQAITDKAAELFEFPAYRFYIMVDGDKKLRAAILKHDVSFYEDAIKHLNNLTDEGTKMFERAKYQKIVFGDSGIPSDEVRRMCEKMDDMYYR